MKQALLLLLLPLLVSAVSAITADEIVAKAREKIGGDARLDSVQSLEFFGEIESLDADNPTTGTVRMRFEKPFKQRLDTTVGDVSSTVGVGDYEGFTQQVRISDGASNLNVMPAEQVARLRSNSAENLYFFKGTERLGGKVTLLGEEIYNGRSAYRVKFEYPSGVGFERLFATDDFDLLTTFPVGQSRLEFVEEGEQVVDGITFAKKVKTLVNGELQRVVTFTEINVNPEFADDTFTFPRTRSSAPANTGSAANTGEANDDPLSNPLE